MAKRQIMTLNIYGREVPVMEMSFKDLQEEYKKDATNEVTDEYKAFYHSLETIIYVSECRDVMTTADLIFHEALHALFHLKYDNLTDHFKLDEEATVRLINACKMDLIDILKQIYNN